MFRFVILAVTVCIMFMEFVYAEDSPMRYEVTLAEDEIDFDGRLVLLAKLTNVSDKSQTVYWGDKAHPKMYDFDIVHLMTKERVVCTRDPAWYQHVPNAALQRHFHKIDPGESVEYPIHLGPDLLSNSQLAYFRRPGGYSMTPTLNVTTKVMLDNETGLESGERSGWTGKLIGERVAFRVLPPEEVGVTGNRIRGKVTLPDGRSAAGAIVQLFLVKQNVGTFYGNNEKRVDHVYADANGEYQFERVPDEGAAYRLMAWSDGHPAASTRVECDVNTNLDGVDITFPKSIVLRGRVVDGQGRPISDVRADSQMRTGADGRFSIVVPESAEECSVNLWRRGYVAITAQTTFEKATQGDWTVAMFSEESVRVRGTANFVDGKPLAQGRLVFKLDLQTKGDVPNRQWKEIRCDTDQQGNFQVELPAQAEYRATVTGYPDHRAAHQMEWTTNVESLSPASSPLKLVFENRGQIEVIIDHAKPLPEKLSLVVECVRKGSHRLMNLTKVRPNTQSVLIERLAPGDYVVRVYLERAHRERWQSDVTIPDKAPFRASTTVAIPDLPFGGLKARFLMPDGKSPAAQTKLRIETAGGGMNAVTDDRGYLRAVDILAGPISFTPQAMETGIAPVRITGHKVERGKITYLGNVRLKHVDEEFGTFAGKLRREDGRPVEASVVGFFAGFDGGIRMLPNYFRPSKLGVDGSFEVLVPKGPQKLIIQLGPALPFGGGYAFSGDIESKRLIVDVDVKPGSKSTCDLTLRRNPGKGKVKVSWPIQGKVALPSSVVIAVRQNGFLWSAEASGQEGSCVFRGVPPGETQVMLRGYYLPYFGIRKLKDVSSDEIAFGDSASPLVLRVIDEQGQLMPNLGVMITAMFGDEQVYVCNVPPYIDDSEENKNARNHNLMNLHADGSLETVGVAAGDYQVTVTDGNWEHRFDVTLSDEKRTNVQLQVAKDGSLMSKTVE